MVNRKTENDELKKTSTVEINGNKIKGLLDKGSTQTLVHRKRIPTRYLCTSELILVCCVHSDKRTYPTADLCIEVQGATYLLKVGVADNLPYPVVLGEDLTIFYDLLKEVQICIAAVTRVQTKNPRDQSGTPSALPIFDCVIEVQPGKMRKS